MIYEYAVSPFLFNYANNIAFLHEAFGVDHGRLISEYPRKKKWIQIARHLIEKTARDDVEKSQLKELLMALERRALYDRQGAHWSDEKSWLANVLDENARRAFRGILNHESVNDYKEVLTVADTWRASQWKSPPSISVPRTAASIVEAVMPLVRLSTTLILIGRNFEPVDARFSKVLVEFAEQLLRQTHQLKITQIKYVTTYESNKGAPRTINMFENECRSILSSIVPRGISVKFIIKVKKLLHDRFVLTNRGCIQLGIGLDADDGDVLLTRLSNDDFMSQLEGWNKQSCHEFDIHGTRN